VPFLFARTGIGGREQQQEQRNRGAQGLDRTEPGVRRPDDADRLRGQERAGHQHSQDEHDHGVLVEGPVEGQQKVGRSARHHHDRRTQEGQERPNASGTVLPAPFALSRQRSCERGSFQPLRPSATPPRTVRPRAGRLRAGGHGQRRLHRLRVHFYVDLLQNAPQAALRAGHPPSDRQRCFSRVSRPETSRTNRAHCPDGPPAGPRSLPPHDCEGGPVLGVSGFTLQDLARGVSATSPWCSCGTPSHGRCHHRGTSGQGPPPATRKSFASWYIRPGLPTRERPPPSTLPHPGGDGYGTRFPRRRSGRSGAPVPGVSASSAGGRRTAPR